VLAELGIKRAVHGAISHPPDGNPLIGPAPGLPNYWLNCGCQIGIGWGPGLTRELARWMVHGSADINMRDFDPRRFGAFADVDYQVTKAKEDYLLRHEIPFSHFNRPDGRPVKPSALYDRLKAKGAVFEEVYGWERPRWFATRGLEQRDYYSFKRPAWHDAVMNEVEAVRQRAGIMDISAFSKVDVSGPDAAAFVDRLIPNRLPKPGRIGLTHLLSDNGRIELETTVVRLADDRLYFTCAVFFEQRLIDLLSFRKRDDETVTIDNLSDAWGALALSGPRSRDILGDCTDAPLEKPDFPWLAVREIDIAGARLWAFRMSYAGELGWELHGPRDAIAAAYDVLWAAGERQGITDYGSFAMNVMRLEKMFKGAGELTNEVTLPEADVMRFVNLDKPDFHGKAATEAAIAAPLKWICVYLAIDDDGVDLGHGGEAVLKEGTCIGATSSVTYSPAAGKLLAFAYVDPAHAEPGTALDVVIMGDPRPTVVLAEPIYDAANEKPRGCWGRWYMAETIDTMRIVADKAAEIVCLKISNLGGLSKARRVRDFFVDNGIPVVAEDTWVGEIVTATLSHFAASTPAEMLVNTTDLHNYNTRSTGKPGPRTASGRLFASNDPGLGVEPDYKSLGEPVARYGVAA